MAITFISSTKTAANSGTSLSLSVPIGTLNGHVLIAAVGIGVVETITPPAGWTSLVAQSGTNINAQIWYRIASSEPASYAFSWTTSTRYGAGMLAYSGVDTSTPSDCTPSAAGDTGIAPSITTTTNGATAIVFGWSRGDIVFVPVGWTERVYDSGSYRVRFVAADKIMAIAGATGNATIYVQTGTVSMQIALRPVLAASVARRTIFAPAFPGVFG